VPKKAKHEETREEIEMEEKMEETLNKDKVKETPKEAAKPKKKKAEKEEEKAEDVIEEVKEKPLEEVGKKEIEEVAKVVERRLSEWIPKTRLGREVVEGKYTDMKQVIAKGEIILEPQIVDYLVTGLREELVYIGGTPGKGGGIRRTPTRMTARMHKSGRRFKLTAVVTVGNDDGIIGIGKASSKEHRTAIEKAIQHAKLNVINVRRGCGSWECNCGGEHSIPFKTRGKAGSVEVKLLPTPVGVGIVADKETKKILKLAGIKDVWSKTVGMSSTRMNLAFAVFEALKNLSRTKGDI
jgi:small subunit ribosomal protein S5